MSYNRKCPDITIGAGVGVSGIVKAKEVYGDAVGIMLYSPEALDGGHTYKIEVCVDPDAASPAYKDLADDNGAVIAPPDAGEARAYYGLAVSNGFRITDVTGNAVADRVWQMSKMFKRD